MSIFNIEKGIIIQQVNCQNAMGAGLAQAIMDKYPIVAEKYHKAFEKYDRNDLYGSIQYIPVEKDLVIVNSFSQFNYGNGKKNGICYTNEELLFRAIRTVVTQNPDKTLYVPYKIGCGLAGADWEYISEMIREIKSDNIVIWDTVNGREASDIELEL